VREDGRIDGGEEWQEKLYDREEWKKLLRMARNRRILHMLMELINYKFPPTCFGTYFTVLREKSNQLLKTI
jgi:hypothetical protein